MNEEPRVFGQRYELVRHIARGGMARVYLARDLLLDRPVAIKVLFPELSVDQAFVQRFRREAQAAANLSHPNIVSIYDWGQGEHTYYIVMEYVDGETLSARIRRGPLAPDQAAIIGISTAAALAFAHRRQVIHRDVKPGNVLIDRSGQVKVADFGIARAVGAGEDLTQAGAVMGTATYFSPEQAQGYSTDARSDVYSLGVVLYEMVVGRPPFQGDSPVAIAYKHVRETPVPPRQLNPAVPAALEAIALTALAKEPAERYQTADALRADLERFRAGQPLATARAVAGTDPTRTAVLAAAPAGATRVNRTVEPTTVVPAATTTAARPPGLGGPARPDEERPSSSGGGWYVAGIVALLAVLGVLGFFLGRDLGLFDTARTLTVPSVRGDSRAAALETLRARGFTDVVTTSVTDAGVKKGHVIGTDPRAGTRLRSDKRLVVDLSRGPVLVDVPAVDSDPEAAAKQALTRHDFKVTTVTQASDTYTSGYVIRTVPPAGSAEPKGSTVRLVVSSGPAMVTIPSVAHDSLVRAATTLSADGFKVSGTTGSQASDTVRSGNVVGTTPPAGTRVRPGSTVTINLSTGPPKVLVPNVIDDTRRQAAAALKANGFSATYTTVPVTYAIEGGLVQSTDPAPGRYARYGSTVTVAMGSYTAPTTTTPTTTAPATTTPASTAPATTTPASTAPTTTAPTTTAPATTSPTAPTS